MGNLGAEHLDFAAIGLPQQGGNLLGEVGAVVHHRQQYAVDLELGVDLPLHLVYGLEQLFQALGGQVLRLNGDYDPVGGGQGVDREHTQGCWQSIRIWEYCPLSVSRYCRRMVSRLMAFTRETSSRRAGCLRASGQRPPVVQDTLAGAQRLVHQDTGPSRRTG